MTDWRSTAGVADSTDKIQVYTAQKLKDELQEEAEEEGLSTSSYVEKLVQEARVYRSEGMPGSEGVLRDENDEQSITELQQEIEQLNQRLDEQESESSEGINFDPATLKQQVLTENYQSLEEILRKIVEGGVLDNLLRQPVENQLYFLAAQDEVKYERGWGWKLADGGEQ